MVDIGDLVAAADHLPFQGFRPGVTGVAQNAHADFVGQIQAPAVPFQHVHHPQTLLIVAEGLSKAVRQGSFPRVSEGGVAQIMAHGDGLGQVLVEAQCPGDGPGDPGDLQSVGHAGAVVVPLRLQKDLGLVHQPPEGFAVDDSVNVPLVAGAHVLLPGRLLPGTAPAFVRKGRKGVEPFVFQPFQFFPHCHANPTFK